MLTRTLFAAALLIGTAAPALAIDGVYYGEIHAFAGNYCPKTWAAADGSLRKINDDRVLFSLLGNAFGGDGHTTFALPDLRSKAPAHLDKDDKGHRFKLLWCIKVEDGVYP